MTGSELYKRIAGLTGEPRETEILNAGEPPPWVLQWIPVTVVSYAGTGETKTVAHSLTYKVARDGWSVGTAEDFLRTPLAFTTAKRLAKARGWTFPTTAMVRQIHAAADVRIAMPTATAEREASSTYLAAHQAIETQRAGRQGLQSGGKKDLVLSRDLPAGTKQIFGGAIDTTPGTKFWQGISHPPAHAATYVDYSEQYRPIQRAAVLDGKPIDLHAVLASPDLAPLISTEGAYDADALLAGTGSAYVPPWSPSLARATPASTPAGRAARSLLSFGSAVALLWGARELVRRWWRP
jgi:hypothetical protein